MSISPLKRLANAAAVADRAGQPLPDDLIAVCDEFAAAILDRTGVVVASGAEPRREINRAVNVPERYRPQPPAHTMAGLKITRPSGYPIEGGFDGLADALGEALGQIGTTGETLVASVRWAESYGDARTLGDGGPADSGKIDAVRVASGGVPGPPEAIYTVDALGGADRPLRDSLPRFLAQRGSVALNRAPLLSSIVVDSGSGSAVTTVTSAQDLADATKGVQEVTNPTAVTGTVRAVAQRLELSNFSDRFVPEWTRAWLRLTLTAASRRAEQLLLTDIAADCAHQIDTPARYSAFRDLKRSLTAIVAELRDRERDYSTPITVAIPSYAVDLCVTDLVAQAPGDESWSVTRDDVIADMRTWGGGLTPVLLYDGTAGRTLTTPTGQSPRSASFDADVDLFVWWSNALLFLDGGQLDLGIVRTSALNASNRFETFYEMFEGVVRVGAQPTRLTISLCGNGATQAPATIESCSPEGS